MKYETSACIKARPSPHKGGGCCCRYGPSSNRPSNRGPTSRPPNHVPKRYTLTITLTHLCHTHFATSQEPVKLPRASAHEHAAVIATSLDITSLHTIRASSHAHHHHHVLPSAHHARARKQRPPQVQPFHPRGTADGLAPFAAPLGPPDL